MTSETPLKAYWQEKSSTAGWPGQGTPDYPAVVWPDKF